MSEARRVQGPAAARRNTLRRHRTAPPPGDQVRRFATGQPLINQVARYLLD